jgi:DNA polymerase-3 subunit beta
LAPTVGVGLPAVNKQAREEVIKMEMRVNALREALEILKPVVPKKPTIAVLKNIFLGEGRAEASDLEVAVSLDLEEADGKCLVPLSPVLDLLKRVPGYELLTIEQKAKHLKLTWSDGSASYEVDKPDDYPGFPEVKAKPQKRVDGDNLVPALSSLLGYCATDESRLVLTGIILFLGENLEIAAGDGFRMAYKSLPVNLIIQGRDNAIVPAQAVRYLAHLWAKTPREAPSGDSIVQIVTAKRMVDLTFDADKLRVGFGRVTMVTKLIQGEPPNMKQLLPKDPLPQVKFMAMDFERAVRGVQVPARDNSGIVRLSWEKKSMSVSAKSDEKGSIETTIPVESDEPGRVALNVNYLLEYIKGKEGLISMSTPGKQVPTLFRHSSSPLVLMMPMFVEW